MITTNFRRQLAAIVCTMIMSTACIVSAVGPVQQVASSVASTQTVA